MISRYRVVLYTVVNNYNGSWGVNLTKTSDKIILVDSVESTASDILKQLKAFGYIESCDKRKMAVSPLDRDLVIVSQKKDKKPLCQLERIRC